MKTNGGERGILVQPIPASADESYTSAIIPCVSEAYKRFLSSATVSIVSPIRCNSAGNGITGISIVEASLRQSLTICQFRRICWPYLPNPAPRLDHHLTIKDPEMQTRRTAGRCRTFYGTTQLRSTGEADGYWPVGLLISDVAGNLTFPG